MILAVAALAALASVSLPVSTAQPQAQALIDRGLFLYYAFDGTDAAATFARAALRDPRLAMAYWGEALADGPDLNTPMNAASFAQGQTAIARARALEAGATPRERSYIDAMALRYAGTWPDWQRDDDAYRRAMTAFADASHGENAELLAAEALLEAGMVWNHGRPATPAARAIQRYVDDVLVRDPTNPMANHLCIHVYDNAADRTPAVPCAQRLDAASFPPQAEHLAHMPAHVWIETGAYGAAAASSQRAYSLLLALDRLDGRQLADERYALHDVTVGYEAAMMLGSYALAQTWTSRMDELSDGKYDALTALRFGRYRAALDAPPVELFGPWVRGIAALRLGDLARATSIAARIAKEFGPPSSGYFAQLFSARLAEAQGKSSAALRWLADATRNQQASFYAEFIPYVPAQEALGGFYLRAGQDAQAAGAFEAGLAAYPGDPRALFGLATALRALGRTAEAARAQAAFERNWSVADTTLTAADL
jgi:tetratricopeptide (TPR) repeat protein